jgi:hypothetical protein
MTLKNKWYRLVMVVGVLCLLGASGPTYSAGPASSAPYTSCQEYQNFSFDEFTKNKPFNLNTLCTTPYDEPDTPAWADIILESGNFVECKGAKIALCYYSGPFKELVPISAPFDPLHLPCILRENGEAIADCTCIEIPAGPNYYVDINAILSLDVYLDTVKKCGMDGSDCFPTGHKEAPVCQAIRNGKLIPGADLISTFSFALETKIPIAIMENSCTEDEPPPPIPYLYAGCMTAPCKRIPGEYDPDAPYPLVQCACPTYQGPFQVGRKITDEEPCDLPDDTVWSAAYSEIVKPTPPPCVPDAPPGKSGCPILPPDFKETVAVPDDVSCQKVCSEYMKSNQNGIQVGFTCDTALCTDPSNLALWAEACRGLDKHSNTEILKLETEVGFSCAASQICGCEPNKKTNEEISRLNDIQRAEPGIEPQCDVNGTLCGTGEPLTL